MKVVRSKIGSIQKDLQKLQRKRSTKFITLLKIEQQTSIGIDATTRSISRTTAHRIMNTLELHKAQFVQNLNEEGFHDRVEIFQTLIPMLETRKFFFIR